MLGELDLDCADYGTSCAAEGYSTSDDLSGKAIAYGALLAGAIAGVVYVGGRQKYENESEFTVDDSRFRVEERLLSLRKQYDILNEEGHRVAYIQKPWLSWGDDYNVFDGDGDLVARIDGKVLAWGHDFDVYDAQGSLIAKIDGKVVSWGYDSNVRDPAGGTIAELDNKLLRINNHLDVSQGGRDMADIDSRVISWTDTYDVQFQGAVDAATKKLVLYATATFDGIKDAAMESDSDSDSSSSSSSSE